VSDGSASKSHRRLSALEYFWFFDSDLGDFHPRGALEIGGTALLRPSFRDAGFPKTTRWWSSAAKTMDRLVFACA
jgi:hypothetical protein